MTMTMTMMMMPREQIILTSTLLAIYSPNYMPHSVFSSSIDFSIRNVHDPVVPGSQASPERMLTSHPMRRPTCTSDQTATAMAPKVPVRCTSSTPQLLAAVNFSDGLDEMLIFIP